MKKTNKEPKVNFIFPNYDNSLSLFETVEKYHPFDRHIESFLARLNDNPETLFLNTELELIRSNYLNSEGPATNAYNHRKARQNHPLKSFAIDFYIWKEINAKIFTSTIKIQTPNISTNGIEKKLEERYIQLLAKGVNDARLEAYILELQAGGIRNNSKHSGKKIPIRCGFASKRHESIAYEILRNRNVYLLDDEGNSTLEGKKKGYGKYFVFLYELKKHNFFINFDRNEDIFELFKERMKIRPVQFKPHDKEKKYDGFRNLIRGEISKLLRAK